MQSTMRGPLVTVDGPAASGKSTLARRLAYHLRVPFLSTGAMYRAVTLLAMRRGVGLTSESALAAIARTVRLEFSVRRQGRDLAILHEGDNITAALESPEVARNTSATVASFRKVRRALHASQRAFLTSRGLVAEGRDCGSVVFPQAAYKFYITSSPEERAMRRWRDLRKGGMNVSLRRIIADMRRRDREDRARPHGALVATSDAWVIDNTSLLQDQTLNMMYRMVTGRDL